MTRVSALPEPLPFREMIPELAVRVADECKALRKFFESPLWAGLNDLLQSHRQALRGQMLTTSEDSELLAQQIGVLVCELPGRIAAERLGLEGVADDETQHRQLNRSVTFETEQAADAAIARGQTAVEAVGSDGYAVWARMMTALTWAHYLALTWCQPSERAVHQAWIREVKHMFDRIQDTIDLGIVAEEFRERQVKEQIAKEKGNGR